MNRIAEGVVFLGAMLASVAVYAIAARHLMREIRRGKVGRLVAVIVYGFASPFLVMVPLCLAYSARWAGALVGFSILPKGSADDGVMVGIGIIGMVIAMGAAVLFALVMIFQALTGSGDSDFEHEL